MNQERIGETLRTLRKEKGFTQEQLAQKLNTTNRTVSRWETGNNLPDISILIELAEFYGVELKDILAGEVKEKIMEPNVKETALLVADYTTAAKESFRKKVNVVCIVSFTGLLVSAIVTGLELRSPVLQFIAGAGVGISLFALVLAIVVTSSKFEEIAKKSETTKMSASSKFCFIVAICLFMIVFYGIAVKIDRTTLISLSISAISVLLIGINRSKREV